MSNKKAGNDFERDFCKMLASKGFWAYNTPTKHGGQPADVIAARRGKAWLIDCKDCVRDVFEFRRIEDNQRVAMDLWTACGNDTGWFALKFNDGVYMLSLNSIVHMQMLGIKQLARTDDNFIRYAWRFDLWTATY